MLFPSGVGNWDRPAKRSLSAVASWQVKGASVPAVWGPPPGWSELGSWRWNYELQDTKRIPFWDNVQFT